MCMTITIHTSRSEKILYLNENLDIELIKKDLKNKIKNGDIKNDYSFEVLLIFKLIHEFSNYDDHCWTLYKGSKKYVKRQLTHLLQQICALENTLAWDCMTIRDRYLNCYLQRHKNSKYIKEKNESLYC